MSRSSEPALISRERYAIASSVGIAATVAWAMSNGEVAGCTVASTLGMSRVGQPVGARRMPLSYHERTGGVRRSPMSYHELTGLVGEAQSVGGSHISRAGAASHGPAFGCHAPLRSGRNRVASGVRPLGCRP